MVDYAIYMLAGEGRVLSWNSGAVRLKGYTPENHWRVVKPFFHARRFASGCFRLDPSGHVVTCTAERNGSKAMAEIIGKHFSMFDTDEDRKARF